jgi:hypothetical protein
VCNRIWLHLCVFAKENSSGKVKRRVCEEQYPGAMQQNTANCVSHLWVKIEIFPVKSGNETVKHVEV